ncbi:MAG: PAS domain S-box protein [Acidobacteriota bacterium]|nr:PAS domain S-box protein [Acidobacteriota bacterium]
MNNTLAAENSSAERQPRQHARLNAWPRGWFTAQAFKQGFAYPPYLAVVAVCGLLLFAFARDVGGQCLGVLIVGAAALTALALARQVAAVRENVQLLAEQSARQSESRFRSLVQQTSDVIMILDENLIVRYVTPSIERIFGVAPETRTGQKLFQRVYPEDEARVAAYFAQALAEPGVRPPIEWRTRHEDGTWRYVECIGTNLLADPDIKGFVLNARDITERKQNEEELRESEARFRTLAETASDAIITLDETSRIVYVNRAAEQVFGYTIDEMLGANLTMLMPENLRHLHRAGFSRYVETGHKHIGWKAVALPGLHKSGREIPLEISFGEFVKNEQRYFTGIARDITERKRAEEALRQAEQKYHLIFESAVVGIYQTTPDGQYLTANPMLARMFGYDSPAEIMREVTGNHLEQQFYVQPGRREEFARRLREDGVVTAFESEIYRRDGSTTWISEHTLALRDTTGQLIGYQGTTTDIADRKRAEEELRSYAVQLQQSNRELQDFAFVASHDLQEPLRKVQAFGDRLKSKYGDGLNADGRDYLERMQSAAGRMQTLINDLLTFSRVTTKAQPFTPVNLNLIAREVLSDLEVKIEETGATINLGELPTIDADPVQMRQLMQNLIGNALKFRRADEAPLIKIQCLTHDHDDDDSTPPGCCRISVADNGIGFDEKYLDRIFTVFQRLHGRSEYEGSGVGLAICRKIVERHGGQLTARSQPGAGAHFIFTLPIKHTTEGVTT